MPSLPLVVDAPALRGRDDIVLADVRWYLDGRDGRDAFESGHLPGARWVDVDRDLSDLDRPATDGRHPFPSPQQFADAMGRLGIGDDTAVVAYDDSGGGTAARLVVMLRMLDHDAALLDGGLAAWDGDLERGPARPWTPATFTARPWPRERFATADETAAAAASGAAVLDARTEERFRGEVVVVDPRPGHVPGARSAPWMAALGPDGRMRSPDDLRDHYAALGVDDGASAIAYCGSGVTACMNVIGLERAGLGWPRLFAAGWSGWSSDPDRPAEPG